METHEERRQYARIQLCAYGIDTVCVVVQGARRCKLSLVDISSGGARLKVLEPVPEFGDSPLTLSVQGVHDGGRLQNLSAMIRWKAGQEIGVQFLQPVDMALSELQGLIS